MLDEPSLGLAPRIVADIFRIVGDCARRRVDPAGGAERPRRAEIADRAYVMELGELHPRRRGRGHRRRSPRHRELSGIGVINGHAAPGRVLLGISA
jgi:ABC-type branched-subunit amino acid transport system ATPase component